MLKSSYKVSSYQTKFRFLNSILEQNFRNHGLVKMTRHGDIHIFLENLLLITIFFSKLVARYKNIF